MIPVRSRRVFTVPLCTVGTPVAGKVLNTYRRNINERPIGAICQGSSQRGDINGRGGRWVGGRGVCILGLRAAACVNTYL